MATYEKYQDAEGNWRWRLREANGRIVADSGEGYEDERGVDRAIENVKGEADSEVEDG